MANPTGVNQVFNPEQAYGEVKRLQELTRSAPVSGAPVAGRALNTPQRAQRSATRGEAAPPAPPPLPPSIPDAPVTKAQTWAELAREPGASELVAYYAQLANAS